MIETYNYGGIMNKLWEDFIAIWLNILAGFGILGALTLIFYFLLCRYIVWADKRDEQVEIDKMRQALK